MLGITAPQGNANQNHTEMALHTRQGGYCNRKTGVGRMWGGLERTHGWQERSGAAAVDSSAWGLQSYHVTQ